MIPHRLHAFISLFPHDMNNPSLVTLPFHHVVREFDEEDGLARPHAPFLSSIVRTDDCRGIPGLVRILPTVQLGSQPDTLAAQETAHDALNHTGDECGAIQLAHLLWYADILVDERLVVSDHVLFGIGGRGLDRICRPGEEMTPERVGDELEKGEDSRGSWLRSGGGRQAVEYCKAHQHSILMILWGAIACGGGRSAIHRGVKRNPIG